MTDRKQLAADCNQADPYRTVCTGAVLELFGIEKESYRFAQTVQDVVRLLRKRGISVRSRKSAAGKATASVGQLRAAIKSGKLGTGFFLVRVPSHAMLLDANGRTVVDTAPRARDRRRVTHVYLVDTTTAMARA